MSKNIYLVILAIFGSPFLGGCGSSSYWINAYTEKENGSVKKMYVNTARTPKVNEEKCDNGGCADDANIYYHCAHNYMLNAISTKALEGGYSYFTLSFPEGSNKEPIAINRIEQHLNYCNAPYYDPKTDLLEDKCNHIGLGAGYPAVMRNVSVKFYKERNPFVPTWNAEKTKRETLKELQSQCYKNDPDRLRMLLGEYPKIQEK